MLVNLVFGFLVFMIIALLTITASSIILTVYTVKDIKFWHDRELSDNGVK